MEGCLYIMWGGGRKKRGEEEETMEKTEKKKDITHITRGASSVPATMNSAARLRLVDFHFYWPPHPVPYAWATHTHILLYSTEETLRTCVRARLCVYVRACESFTFFLHFFPSLSALSGKICEGTRGGYICDLWSSAVIVVRVFSVPSVNMDGVW